MLLMTVESREWIPLEFRWNSELGQLRIQVRHGSCAACTLPVRPEIKSELPIILAALVIVNHVLISLASTQILPWVTRPWVSFRKFMPEELKGLVPFVVKETQHFVHKICLSSDILQTDITQCNWKSENGLNVWSRRKYSPVEKKCRIKQIKHSKY